jgi:TPP-dependent 2-oxoacid decarboxylase
VVAFNILYHQWIGHPDKKNQQRNSRLNNTIDLIGLTKFYRVFYPATAQFTFFSEANGTVSKIDHILEHKESLNKDKNIKISPAYYLTTTQ